MTTTPKYQRLVAWIKEQIAGGELTDGDKLYSEHELAAMFAISRQTVRQAVGILEKEGLVERRRGSGTYVTHRRTEPRPHTRNIGVISTYLDSYIFPAIIKGIESVLSADGYSMQLSLTNNQVQNESRALRAMLDKGVDGFIVEPTKSSLPNPNGALYEEIRRRQIPLIFFNAYYPDSPFPHICLNDRLAGRMAAQHLLDMGHRRIAGLFQSDDRQGLLRYAGYVEALGAAGLAEDASRITWFTTEDIPYLPEDFGRIRRSLDGCTAMVCYNDQIAYTVISELKKAGIAVPEDISVVGIDNSPLAAICEVPITSLAHPMETLGQACAQHLLCLIDDPGFQATLEFDPKLVERESVLRLGTR